MLKHSVAALALLATALSASPVGAAEPVPPDYIAPPAGMEHDYPYVHGQLLTDAQVEQFTIDEINRLRVSHQRQPVSRVPATQSVRCTVERMIEVGTAGHFAECLEPRADGFLSENSAAPYTFSNLELLIIQPLDVVPRWHASTTGHAETQLGNTWDRGTVALNCVEEEHAGLPGVRVYAASQYAVSDGVTSESDAGLPDRFASGLYTGIPRYHDGWVYCTQLGWQWRVTSAVQASDSDVSAVTTFEQLAARADLNGTHADILRLYWAAFDREPDVGGAEWWINSYNTGAWPSLVGIAEHFAVSEEFINTYGQLSNTDFVDAIYLNVLDRPGESAGRAFWINELDTEARTRGEVLADFSYSDEFRANQPLPSDNR